MSVIKDWTYAAAEEILAHGVDLTLGEIQTIIWKHCPFEPDKAYEEIPGPQVAAAVAKAIRTYAVGGTADELNTRRGQGLPKAVGRHGL